MGSGGETISSAQTSRPGELAHASPDELSGAPDLPGRLVVISSRSLWAVALTALAVLATVGFTYAAWDALIWILTAAILAIGLNPAVAALERRGLSRNAASSIAAALATGALVVVVLVVAPPPSRTASPSREVCPGSSRTSPRGAARSASWRPTTTSSSAFGPPRATRLPATSSAREHRHSMSSAPRSEPSARWERPGS